MINRFSVLALALAARLSATTTGSGVDIQRFAGLSKIVLSASNTEGAGQTADVKLQHSDDNTTFVDAGVAFTQVTNTTGGVQEIMVNVDKLKRYVRVVDTLAGTTPFVTRSVTLIGKRAY